jgi:hypothetical protein
MAAVGENDTRALSIGRRWRGDDDPIRVDDDSLVVQLRELHECHEGPRLLVRGEPRGIVETCGVRASRSSLCAM